MQVNSGKIEIGTYDDPRDYSNSVIINKDIILKLNDEIKSCGELITNNLVSQKKNEFKTRGYILKKETFMYKTEVYKALTEALQMLKVTKELQHKLT